MSEERAREVLRKQGMTETEAQEFIEGVKIGIKSVKEGKCTPWDEVLKELGI